MNQFSSTRQASSTWRPAVAGFVGLTVLQASSAAWAQFLPLDPAQVVINAAGGQTANDGLQIQLGNLGGIQVVREGTRQYYGDVPTGPEGVNNGFFMAVGLAGQATVYGPQLDIQWQATPWTAVSQSAVTGEGTAASPYQVVTVVSAGGYSLGQTVRYVVPNVYFDVRLTLVPPAGNTQGVRIYHWLDTYLNGGDYGGAYSQPQNSPTVVGVEKNGQYELLIQGNRAWNAYFSGTYYIPGQLMELGGSLDNSLNTDPNTDNGIAAQWDIGTPTGPVTWTYRLATVQVNNATCGDGAITGYEGCDDGDTTDGDGCSSICQVEVGYACTGAPSSCAECFEDVDCDDGDDCTIDTCSANACNHNPAAVGSSCLTGVCTAGGSCVECVADGDCGVRGMCNTQTNTCYCTLDADCDDDNECTSELCTQGQCEYSVLSSQDPCSTGHCNGDQNAPLCICEADADCDDQNSCSVEICLANQCVYDFADASDPCDNGFCSADSTPVCVECVEDSHCDDQNECTQDACTNNTCSQSLEPGKACAASGFCSDVAAVCVECVTSANCPNEAPVCDAYECVECAADPDCDDGNDCTQDTCSASVCTHPAVTEGTACAGGYCAGTNAPACVTCADSQVGALDDGCSSNDPVCLVVGNGATCVRCEAGGNSGVDFGCDGQTPFCDEAAILRTCVACRTTADCADGETCSGAGSCVSEAGAIDSGADSGAAPSSTGELDASVAPDAMVTLPTANPTVVASVTAAPSTVASTTAAPSTVASTTAAPSTVMSTTPAPTAVTSTTAAPSTVASTTAAPSTVTSTTAAPTGVASVTAAPTVQRDAAAAPVTSTDVVEDAGADAGVSINVSGDGCGCGVVGAQSKQGAPSALWLLGLVGLLFKRRARVS